MKSQSRSVAVALIGNPKCGKTTIFNRLAKSASGAVNRPSAGAGQRKLQIIHLGWTISLIELPGVYSLSSQSPEELECRNFLQNEPIDIVLNVLDSCNLDRGLFLTTQLIEMGRPRIYAMNMIDKAQAKGIKLDAASLATMLDGRVVETAATSGEGVASLLDAIIKAAGSLNDYKSMIIRYDGHLEEAIQRVQWMIKEFHPGVLSQAQARWLGIKLLEGDHEIIGKEGDHQRLVEMSRQERGDLARNHGDDCETMFVNARYGFIHGLLEEARVMPVDSRQTFSMTRRIDKIMLHRIVGIPIFFILMWVMFETTFTVGQYPMNWIYALAGWVAERVGASLPGGLFRSMVVDGVIAGVGGTIVFLPNVIILFMFMALFSETGYLFRAAFLLDRLMHAFGLHGKAFIPLVMGFGCNVPAIMACRTIENQRARLIAILIIPFMSCTARLPVFILFAGAFFTRFAGAMVFAIYMLSIASSMAAAVFLSRFVVQGGKESFVMELPPYRKPTARVVLFHMWENAVGFLRKVGGVILIGSIIIWFLQAFPSDIEYSMDYESGIAKLASDGNDEAAGKLKRQRAKEKAEKSYLGKIGLNVAPLFKPLGFSWKDTIAILTGFGSKEVVVASYAVLYAEDLKAAGQKAGLQNAIAGNMKPLSAFAFMAFVLLYCPCLSTIAVIRRETGTWKWAVFSIGFSLAFAWLIAFGIIMAGGLFP